MKMLMACLILFSQVTIILKADASVFVDGRMNVFGAGHTTPPGTEPGLLPPFIDLPANALYVDFPSITGTVSYDTWVPDTMPYYGPDGGPIATNILSSGGISGIKNNRYGFLAGVFVGNAEPTIPPPATFDFTGVNNLTGIRPDLCQTFFIGDGLRGTGNGQFQRFFVPPGSTRLFLGLADGYDPITKTISGPPDKYNDNGGGFNVEYSVKVVPQGPNIVNVDGRANLFGAGHANPPGANPGLLPPCVDLPPNTVSIEFSSVSGEFSVDISPNPSHPETAPFYEANGAAGVTDILSAGGISGLKHNKYGFLAGVFTGDLEPTDPAPPVLDFSENADFTELAPLLNQSFLIGDGLTDGSGSQRKKIRVPAGATRLFLGLADGWEPVAGTISGPPQYYDDNGGMFSVEVKCVTVPEPSSFALLCLGILCTITFAFRRYSIGILVLGLIALPVIAAQGALIGYEGFSYPMDNLLQNLNGGSGFSDPWFVTGDNSYMIGGNSIFDPSGLLSTEGNSLNNTGYQPTARRNLDTMLGYSDSTIYVSFLLQKRDEIDSWGGIILGGINVEQPEVMYGIHGLFVGGSKEYPYGLNEAGTRIGVSSAVPVVTGQTALLVTRIDFRDGVDKATLYINPIPGSPEPANGLVWEGIDLGTFSQFSITQGDGSAWTTDEIRIATTWEEATPLVPEPSTFVLLVVVALGLAAHVRRQQKKIA